MSTKPGELHANQAMVNDPIVLLQDDIQKLVDEGYSFEGTAINIATQTTVNFLSTPNSGAAGAQTAVSLPHFGGGIGNIPFLLGQQVAVGNPPKNVPEENAQTALVYATFWIEKATKKGGGSFTQLQYAQMVVLNFPVFHLLRQNPPVYVNLGWPHISVATLRKTFG